METRLYESIEHKLSREEISILGEELAALNQMVFELEAEKKTKLADFTARLKEFMQQIQIISGKISTGIDSEQVEIMVLLDTPRPGRKSFLRVDTNEVLRTEDMTPQERQHSFGFEEPGEESS